MLDLEKSNLLNDIKSVYEEAKDIGFDTKIMRQIIRIKKSDEKKRAKEEALLDLYKKALKLE